MGAELPILPVHGKEELMLFQNLARNQAKFDAERMAIDWCDHVDGVTVFPKLPVYLRTHYESWKKKREEEELASKPPHCQRVSPLMRCPACDGSVPAPAV